MNWKGDHRCELGVSSGTKPPLGLVVVTKLPFLSAASSDFKMLDLTVPSHRARRLTGIRASLSEVTQGEIYNNGILHSGTKENRNRRSKGTNGKANGLFSNLTAQKNRKAVLHSHAHSYGYGIAQLCRKAELDFDIKNLS